MDSSNSELKAKIVLQSPLVSSKTWSEKQVAVAVVVFWSSLLQLIIDVKEKITDTDFRKFMGKWL
jgi:hypothetical protein